MDVMYTKKQHKSGVQNEILIKINQKKKMLNNNKEGIRISRGNKQELQ